MNKIPQYQQRRQRRPSRPGRRRARLVWCAAGQAGLGAAAAAAPATVLFFHSCSLPYFTYYLIFDLIWFLLTILDVISIIGSGWWLVVLGGGGGWWWLEAPADHGRPHRPFPAHRFWPGVENLVL